MIENDRIVELFGLSGNLRKGEPVWSRINSLSGVCFIYFDILSRSVCEFESNTNLNFPPFFSAFKNFFSAILLKPVIIINLSEISILIFL